MKKSLELDPQQGQVMAIQRSDRWLMRRRLQELQIPSACPTDGTLRVDITSCLDLILTRSILQQFTAPRHELVDWLDRCWCTQVFCSKNN